MNPNDEHATDPDAAFAASLREALRPQFAGRRFIVTGGAVPGLGRRAHELSAVGAEFPFLLAQTRGTGEPPAPEAGTWASVEATGDDVVEVIHRAEAAMERPAPAIREAIDRWDPDGTARAIGTITLSSGRTVAGRPFLGGRTESSLLLEDKTRVDETWDAAGIPRAPSRFVETASSPAAWSAAHRALDRGAGTVWAGDARDGLNGGTERVRHAREEADLDAIRSELGPRADRLRVMPFLDGVPCSIHAVVLRGGIAVLRPVEMVIFRPPAGTRFRYGGLGTFWDPPADRRREMRTVARAIAAHARDVHGHRGALSVDGVMTAEGFRPTEINARWAAGIETPAAAIPGLPIWLLHVTAVAGVDPDVDAGALERHVVAAADRVRSGGSWISTDAVPTGRPGSLELAPDGDDLRPARPGEAAVGRLEWGPGGTGGFLRWKPDPAAIFPGPAFAPRARAVWRAADRLLDTEIGPLGADEP